MPAKKVYLWLQLPNEVKLMIINRLPDIQSLHNLTRTDDFLGNLVAFNFRQVLSSVLANGMPRDLQEIVFTMISIQDSAPFRDTDLSSVFNNIFFDESKGLFRLLRQPSNPLKVLHRVARTSVAVEFFTALFPEVFALRHDDFKDVQLNDGETHRLQRGLWRFEVCCALIESWKSLGDASLQEVYLGADTRVPRLTQYLGRFVPWELEEIACVYEYLELAVLRTGFGLPASHLPHSFCNSHGGQDSSDTTGCEELIGFIDGARHDTSHSARRMIAGTVGLFAPLGQEVLTPYEIEAAAKARILSQGLIFLRAFQDLPLVAKAPIQSRLNGCCLGDEFFHAALYNLMDWHNRFPLEVEQQITASPGLWNTMDSYKDNPNFVKGTDMANDRWQDLVGGNFPTWYIDAGVIYPPHAKFRSWGYSIWSRPRTCTNTEQRDFYDCFEYDICRCHFCMDCWD